MEFGIGKCATLVLKARKITKFDGISLHDGRIMKELIERASYKYLCILQAEKILYSEMKEKMNAEYFMGVGKVLQTKLNGGNIIKRISTWAWKVSTPQHSYTAIYDDLIRSKN